MAELSKAMQLMSFQILHYKRLDLLSVYRDVLQVIWTNAPLLRQSHSWHSHRIKARYSYCDVVERRATFARHNKPDFARFPVRRARTFHTYNRIHEREGGGICLVDVKQ